MVVVAEDRWWFAEGWVDHRTKRRMIARREVVVVVWLRGAGCPGQGPDVRARPDVRGTGRMSGVPEPARTRCKGGFRGKNSVDFSDEIWGKVEEKLDPHVAQQIHGTNSTKSCQINRSQKIFGALFVGQFSKLGRTRQKQARKRCVGLQNREKPLL